MPKADIPPELGPEFLFRDARGLGISRRRLAASDLTTPFRGTRALPLRLPDGLGYFERRDAELLHRCRAYLHVAPADFRFSHVTAALLHGIPLPQKFAERTALDVTVAVSSVPRRAGVVGHRLRELPAVVMVKGLPTLPAEFVWVQLAAVLSVDELVVAGDYLVRRKAPASTLQRLTAAADVAEGRPGAARLRQAAAETRAGTDSPPESRLRLVIVRAGLPEPVIGHTVYFQGFFVGTPDLTYVKEKIALDYDGKIHREDERVYADDIERRQLFADAEWRYITVATDALRVPRSFLSRLERLLRERG
ncbi:hypothetical protein HD599_000565 [Conyzicola lurida]|uniref:DUF559 domain-containing protein n=1 Tax=Conyzicola lurida TaxID=1172621 RepID=A0A841AJV8_9MICO|nr:hypothetical protein [Conyzicola lurida]MBB5842242.1 hypothetical protein [Conyzicola lurida]